MNTKALLGTAIKIASAAFEGVYDKQGEPYILHCIRVMNEQVTDTRKIIGILHDVVEDYEKTGVSFEDLQSYGFGLSVLIPLKLLTHDKTKKSYDEYIKELAPNDDARAIKLADLKDNSQITRLKGLTKADYDRIEKYHRSYVYLSKV